MKILVKNLEANPHRLLDKYPVIKSVVEGLKISIKSVGIMGSLDARPHPTKKGKYQIAFGHHRVAALIELKWKEAIEINVSEMDDDLMADKMAQENYKNWGDLHPSVQICQVESTKNRLKKRMDICSTLKDFEKSTLPKFWQGMFKNQRAFETSKGMGVGGRHIQKALGDNWIEHRGAIEEALKILKMEVTKTIDMNIISILPNMYQIGQFRKIIVEKNISKTDQKKLAKKAAEVLSEKKTGGRKMLQVVEALADDEFASEIIDMLDSMEQVDEFRKAVHLADIPKAKQKKIAQTMVDNKISTKGIVENVLEQVKPKTKDKPEDPDVVQAKKLIEQIGNEADALDFKISKLDSFLRKLNVTELSGLEVSIAGMKLKKLKNHILQIERRSQETKQEQKQLVGYNIEI